VVDAHSPEQRFANVKCPKKLCGKRVKERSAGQTYPTLTLQNAALVKRGFGCRSVNGRALRCRG